MVNVVIGKNQKRKRVTLLRKCQQCNNKFYSSDSRNVLCEDCSICFNCNGTGKLLCPICSGTGMSTIVFGDQAIKLLCVSCEKGWVACPYCKGGG